MQESLQFTQDREIGGWFLLEEHTFIRVYGFTHERYIFPAFLTLRVFALDIVRQKLIVENEHFISFKKSSEIKFPWVIGPFIIVTLPVVESLLQEMDFKKDFFVNYDPQHVISQRRQMNKNKASI